MSSDGLDAKLDEILTLPTETEWVEFKENRANSQEIGEYISAVSNSAALCQKPCAYIVWGVEDGSHRIVGTSFRPRKQKGAGNEDLEPWLARSLRPHINFRIHELQREGKPIVVFEVPAARAEPVAFSGTRYIRVGSHKKRLREFPGKEGELWRILLGSNHDWSAEICESATLDDLDPAAITLAREEYSNKHEGDARKAHLAEEVWNWDDATFLNKAKVCIGGRITRTAIILLGREEATHHLSPGVAQITWILKDKNGIEQDYRHFGPPFLSAVDDLFAQVRNLTIRHMPDGTLFPIEVSQYDPWVLRETLHNCIAHQDYSLGGRINVVEQPGSLLFTNLGKFIPGSVEEVIARDGPQERYTNRFLADAMVNLNMIDTIGSGIKRAFGIQRDRNFPMPTYDLSEEGRIKVRVIGQILDPNYTRMLMSKTDLDLLDVIALDKVQKRAALSNGEFHSLKAKGLIEGRRPNLIVSAHIAKATNTVADYLRRRGIDKDYCQRMLTELLEKQGEASRPQIDGLLQEKLSDVLDSQQKRTFIRNLLQEMRRDDLIEVHGKGPAARWRLRRPD